MISEPQDFQTLLAETGIEFRPPPDFVPCPVRENSVFYYQHAVRSPSGDLEVRYRVDSFARLEAERKAAAAGLVMQASVSLDQMYAANYMGVLFNLSGGMFLEPKVLRAESTALLFSADWCALSFVRLANNDFAPDYDTAYVQLIHKNGVADVYVIGLYHNTSDDLPLVVKNNLAPSLRFA